ncbi:MAG: type II toxin-antitoxin system HicB family antitoxin [Acidobacteriia bacterium]|nr:type II toxin-antitoxin system HicB family antitoxin [Terriglobia bacterium]
MFLLDDPRDTSPLDVYLESNRAGRTLAHVSRLPGCVVRGETPEEAFAAVPEAIQQHLGWLAAHSGRDFSRRVRIRTAGGVPGGAPTGSGSRGGLLPTDLIPVEAEGLAEHLRRIEYSRRDSLEVVARVPAGLLTARPGPRQWTIRETLQHVAAAEQFYLSRLFKLARFQPQPTPLDRLRIVRDAAYRLLAQCDLRRANRTVRKLGETWTLRKVLRRFLDHEREHVLCIEWRLHLAGLPFAPGWMTRRARKRELGLAEAFRFR